MKNNQFTASQTKCYNKKSVAAKCNSFDAGLTGLGVMIRWNADKKIVKKSS